MAAERRKDDRMERANLESRVAVIESKLDAFKVTFDDHIDNDKTYHDKVLNKMDAIQTYQRRQQGFVGGMIFIISSIFGAVALMASYFGSGHH